MGTWAKECGQLLKAGKKKGWLIPIVSIKELRLNAPWVEPRETHSGLLASRTKRWSFYFKPLHLQYYFDHKKPIPLPRIRLKYILTNTHPRAVHLHKHKNSSSEQYHFMWFNNRPSKRSKVLDRVNPWETEAWTQENKPFTLFLSLTLWSPFLLESLGAFLWRWLSVQFSSVQSLSNV